ncbi:hypothetical protein ACHAWX_004790 [Stephanocyclus meneghinianus]
MRSNQSSFSSTFGTILIRRKANERPTDLELRLRPLSQKIRIVEKLAGGAHLMVTGSPSVAMRFYTMDEINELERRMDESDGDVEGLKIFRDSFEHSVVFFVLPRGEDQRDQLGRRESFVNSAQQALLSRNNDGLEDERDAVKKRATRTLIVPDFTQAIRALDSILQSLSPEKREKKRQYFAQIANQNYLPNKENGNDPTNESIANHVSKTFHEWAERFEMPQGDSNVLLNFMGTLGDVITADAKALDDVPIRNATKEIVSLFFGSSKDHFSSNDHTNVEANFDTGSISDPFDSIDDEELLQLTEPNATQTVQDASQWSDVTNVNDFSDGLQTESYQDGYFQSNFNSNATYKLAQGRDFSNSMDFTPIQAPYSAASHNQTNRCTGGYYAEEAPIIPESYAQHSNFHRHSQHGYNPSYSIGRVPQFGSPPLSSGGNHQGGYAFDHLPSYYTQQFM